MVAQSDEPEQQPPKTEEEEEEDEDEEEEESEEEIIVKPKRDTAKFDLLHEFEKETETFLNDFNDLVENQTQYRTLYILHLNPVRERIIYLLLQYIQKHLPRDDFLCKHIKCCQEDDPEVELYNSEEFLEHYAEVHEKDNEALSAPEMATIDTYYNLVYNYTKEGKVVNKDLLFHLRRILRKINLVMGGWVLECEK